MSSTPAATVFIVDDDAAVRDALAWLLRSRRLHSQGFGGAEEFSAALAQHLPLRQPACLLLDIRLRAMSGLALFEQLVHRSLLLTFPVIFLTGHADVRTAVDAVKRGAFDFCEKPFSDNALVDRIEQALAQSAQQLQLQQVHQGLHQRLSELTERERNVMARVIEGLPNKIIADQLHISVRTVEVHRARVFDKMQVKSAVELANVLRTLDENGPSTTPAKLYF